VYDQNWNQIWVQNGSSAPLQVDGIQGRAPWWSPSGTAIAFETILTPEDLYNPFLRICVLPLTVDPPSVGTAQLITPADLSVQHAKWSPDGTRIVFAYVIRGGKPTPPGDVPPQGIAIVDLSSTLW
jgi:Tol biopolymer transport system component